MFRLVGKRDEGQTVSTIAVFAALASFAARIPKVAFSSCPRSIMTRVASTSASVGGVKSPWLTRSASADRPAVTGHPLRAHTPRSDP